ncbi:Anaphase-promoting complex subunit 10 [Castilleja foliolosa]|uniref:Anaphase-promoting complex subunit 10 n=1 Tax=Castilleja foliolosa TaxID=1961234 RepID=A0ABD3D9N1_9LAMI
METFVNTFLLQIVIMSNYLNGRETRVRQVNVCGPQTD